MKNLFFFGVILTLCSCGASKNTVMFKEYDNKLSKLNEEVLKAESNYVIECNDYLKLSVYTQNGEQLIDPENQLTQTGKSSESNTASPTAGIKYLVNVDGFVKFPMLEPLMLQGFSIADAEQIIAKKYAKFYTEPFVRLTFLNKRVTLLGSDQGGEVIPLENENLKVTEIIALSKSIKETAKVNNIRLLRGEEVYLINLSTIDGYLKSNMIVQNGDIIYIEPLKKPFTEFIRDNGPIISILSSVASLVAVIISLNN
ncbi:polysaccharide biosynthesis/export family protein [Fulvivirga sediminis]|uniref:Polysaccharide biosynthesis/export family protein n=1 Tax=Fulvivirga sediminis TaxID=2803949 RepID=A0A937F8I4_9BACT|nr:polysaccharide biosynthesis/export family protein [Fulvivirga sediminis]MBL3656235.1 polysaccharide biosynthesis/export family protein [Fulvivirga sediminis]